ncbi:glycosyltransferase family 4 protein [Sulfurimonas autotrophica]|uniref:Glycosyl transferase group 1 n=1 Tax=Sulfurimonas autotrophica (strain ATCC BAA-671 / DSM 16294 / JCM 11897 / OK10) TaxID=563040 RepID=E0UV24_SULAO|nr:glycosyltransferase family 4 protein [Sulfurimonas autotrophica]ADN09606.1 glycosyl transferase group 1 [Sulfurimonas autotrophica DSM 16294]
MKNKNILELCLAHGLGGLELFVASCYENFSSKATCKVVVAPGTKLDNYLENIDKFHIQRNKLFPFIPALQLAKYIDENDIDIVHFHWTRDIITAVLAKVLSKKKPKLVQSRHMRMTRFKDDFYHKWLYKNIDMMHAVTLQVKEQLEKFIPSEIRPKIGMVYLGVKASKIDEVKVAELKKQYNLKDEFIVGIVGRIEEGKGQYKVIEALYALKDLDIKVLIVGSAMDEEYLKTLQDKVSDLGLKDKVIFTGFTKDVDEYMQCFDVNILATENETFGLVVVEAMVNRVPMIATNKGGPLEIIEDGADGLLFDGSINDLAEKIELLYKNKDLKESISKAGYLKAREKFDWDKQLDKLYKAMI